MESFHLVIYFILVVKAITSMALPFEPSTHPTKCKTQVLKFNLEEDVAVALAKYTADLSKKFIKEKGSFSLVLSGGTLIDTLRKLVEPPYLNSLDWSKWLIFWVDERVVPLNHKDSNYLLAYQGFLSKVPIPSSNIYAVRDGINLSPKVAAMDYEKRIKKLVLKKIIALSNTTGFPKFDLELLGMGPDGHVASLFPNKTQRHEKKRWVTFITDSPKPPPPRITFTFPVINSASEIAMVLTGSDLAGAVKIVLGGSGSGLGPLPAAQVSAENELTWFLDKAAASKL